MAVNYTISFSDTENIVLTKVAELHGNTAQELVQNIGYVSIKSQALQYLSEEAKNKVDLMSIPEKITFLTE